MKCWMLVIGLGLVSSGHGISSSVTYSLSQRYEGSSALGLMDSEQLNGYAIILRLLTPMYGKNGGEPTVRTECNVVHQKLSFARRELEEDNVFRHTTYLDVDFDMTWSSNEVDVVSLEYPQDFKNFMNSEIGIDTIIENIQELGVPVQSANVLRIISGDTLSFIPAAATPRQSVNYMFSQRYVGSQLTLMNRDQISGFQIFLQLFTQFYGKSGGEPNVKTTCKVTNQYLSYSHRNLQTTHLRIAQNNRQNQQIQNYLQVEFNMTWTSTNIEVDVKEQEYAIDFIQYMNSDGKLNLLTKLRSLGLAIENCETLRIVHMTTDVP